MPNFANAKIYKLVNTLDDKIYVGSTCSKLSTRRRQHKAMSKSYPDFKVYNHLNQVGWDNIDIELIENYSCESKEELLKRERYWIETLKSELNTQRPILYSEDRIDNRKESYQRHKEKVKEKSKEYREKNKEYYLEYLKEYRETHKEEKIDKSKEYYQLHKEEIIKKAKEYRDLNREKISKKDTCECGGRYTHSTISKHIKTKKHLNYIETKNHLDEVSGE